MTTLSIKTQNKPEVLFKITGLLRRKCFVIKSLNFKAKSKKDDNISSLEIILIDKKNCLDGIINQLTKIIEVLSVKIK